MADFQIWLVRSLKDINPVGTFMRTAWGWPVAESVHFLGLSLLIGAIGLFDLRLLGMARRIPIAALHRLIPWGLTGYGINVVSGAAFLMTDPDQLSRPAIAGRAAAFYWEHHDLGSLARAGDIVGVTRAINGGQTGLVDRQAAYIRARDLIGAVA